MPGWELVPESEVVSSHVQSGSLDKTRSHRQLKHVGRKDEKKHNNVAVCTSLEDKQKCGHKEEAVDVAYD